MEYFRLFLSGLVSLVVNLVSPLGRRRAPKLLVIKLDHLGDVLTALPVFEALREAMPDARVDALVGPWGKDALSENPYIDRILVYESKRFSRGAKPGGLWHGLRSMRFIAARQYTHIVELRGDSWTLLLPFLGGVTNRVDRGSARLEDWLDRRMGGSQSANRPPLHEVETNLEIIRPLVGHPVPLPSRAQVYLSDADRRALSERARSQGIPEGVPVVTIHPGASWRPRAWRPERFAEVAVELLGNYPGIHVAFVGTIQEHDILDKLMILIQNPNAHYFFDLRITETAALLERSVLFIGSDSGIAHLAAACGAPLITLFGPQDPLRFRPWSEQGIVLHKPVPCFPCKQMKCVVPNNPCVNLIFVEEVMRAAETFLGPPVVTRKATPARTTT